LRSVPESRARVRRIRPRGIRGDSQDCYARCHSPAATLRGPLCPLSRHPRRPRGATILQRFCDKTAAEIGGLFDPSLWTEKILQLCHSDAPIRYATIALAALAKWSEVTSFPTRLSLSGFPQIDHRHLDEHHRYALRQYSRAIASLREVLSDGRRHLRTSLTCSILFMSFEALQGNYDGALTHLRGSLRTRYRRFRMGSLTT